MDSQQTTSKIDVYQLVTDQIISLLEQGIVPWQRPWAEAGVPANLLSKRQYRGINLWLLLSLNYEQNYFLTWDQIKSKGGSVNKGETGHIVVFWKPVQKKAEEDNDTKQKQVPMLRYYKVFNIAQCRDIPENLIPPSDLAIVDHEPLLECEGIINTMADSPTIVHKEQKAYYRIDTDIINMPKKKSFKSLEGYYSTLYHELVHSTGAEKRLGRKTLTDMVPFGSESYAMEELIAEMGSAYLCRFSGILPTEIKNTVAYLDNWLGVFKKDKRFIISASGQAQKAVDLILGRQAIESKDEVEEPVEESMVS
ncbi:MAG TPA: zincin-like metallopeptidase domain-containing protein [Hanamia sp.]